ncbi:Dbl homology domain-containing protein [Dichotomocladium elegans]|nr:Dbl homology domain-containing protein [Dichotomocladium elegans]
MAIEELIETEDAYVAKLRTTVKLFTQKLNPKGHVPRRIIDPYDYKKVFSNIEDLLAVNEKFLLDLFNCKTNYTIADLAPPAGGTNVLGFGEVCASHMAGFAECYRTYLLNYFNAQVFHASVMKNNSDYCRFIYEVLNDPQCENKTLFDYLIEPPQRIGRYTMLLKNILVHTSPEHPDYMPLREAFAKANEIALLTDDEATKRATMCYALFNSVKRAPCTMLSQHRTPIAFMDASELHRETSKPKRPVTIVLFSDKILVAERPNYHSHGIDLLDPVDTSLDGFFSRNLSKDPNLKFRGWADIEQVQFFKGAPGIPDTFLISASNAQQRSTDPAEPPDNLDAYFQSGGPRLFQAAVQPEGVQKLNEFIEACHRAQALTRRHGDTGKARHSQWSETNVYANIYDTTSYPKASYKNNIAVVFVEQDRPTNMESLFAGKGSATPWVVALVQGRHKEGNRRDGFRFSIVSKVPLKPSRRIIQSTPCAASISNNPIGSWGSHVTEPIGKSMPLFPQVFWDNSEYT